MRFDTVKRHAGHLGTSFTQLTYHFAADHAGPTGNHSRSTDKLVSDISG
jgi:hypothetical protein